MKYIGNLIAGAGLISSILSICGYDSNPVVSGAVTVVGLALLYIGYRISNSYTDQEDILGSDVGRKGGRRNC